MNEVNQLETLRAEMKVQLRYDLANAITKGVNAIVFVKYMQQHFPNYYDEVVDDMNSYKDDI